MNPYAMANLMLREFLTDIIFNDQSLKLFVHWLCATSAICKVIIGESYLIYSYTKLLYCLCYELRLPIEVQF